MLFRMLVLAAACSMFGCRYSQLTDLPGKYVVKTDWGESTLILRADRTMEQEVRTANGVSRHISGTWQFANEIVTIKPCFQVGWKIDGAPVEGCGSGVTVTALGK